jgi:hypothetical protein
MYRSRQSRAAIEKRNRLCPRSLISYLPILFLVLLPLTAYVGIPVKVNIDSGGKPNGVPERR